MEIDDARSKDKMVTLILNGDSSKKVVVNREKAARSCSYLDRLLTSGFREATQDQIEIHLNENYSYECFKAVLEYAIEKNAITTDNFQLAFEMIQLAKIWLYDELADEIEALLLRSVNSRTAHSFLLLALQLNLESLRQKVEDFTEETESKLGNTFRKWGRCPAHMEVDGFGRTTDTHHFMNCKLKKIRYRYQAGESWQELNKEDLRYIRMQQTKAKARAESQGQDYVEQFIILEEKMDCEHLKPNALDNFDWRDDDATMAEKLGKILTIDDPVE